MSSEAWHRLVRDACRQWPDSLAKAFFRAQEAVLFRQVDIRPPSADLGCGTGAFASLLGQRLDIGIDHDLGRIQHAWRAGPYRLCLVANLGEIPLATGSVTTAVANSVLEHVESLDAVLAEIRRVLAPHGELLFTAPGARKREWLLVAEQAESSGRAELAELYRRMFDSAWGHLRYLEPGEWTSRLSDAGFRSIDVLQYESRAASHLVDSLNNFDIRFRPSGAGAIDSLRLDIAAEHLARMFADATGPVVVADGANVFCRART